MNKIQNISIGDIIKNEETSYEGFRLKDRVIRECVVIGVYPYHVLARDIKTWVKRSFNYGDLVTMRIEHQGAEPEMHYPRFKVSESEKERKELKSGSKK